MVASGSGSQVHLTPVLRTLGKGGKYLTSIYRAKTGLIFSQMFLRFIPFYFKSSSELSQRRWDFLKWRRRQYIRKYKNWPEILTSEPNLTGKRWSQLWNLFFSWKVWLLAFRNCLWKNFEIKTKACSPGFVRRGQVATVHTQVKKLTRSFDFEFKFDREALIPALKSFFSLKGMTLSFQELFLKYF